VTFEEAFGEAVRDHRDVNGMSQEDLAVACGRHRTYVSLIERGRNSPSLRTIDVMAGALGVLPYDLVAYADALRKGRTPWSPDSFEPCPTCGT
jgi:transcriptional regulator with XRE-family HTH domain